MGWVAAEKEEKLAFGRAVSACGGAVFWHA